VEGILDRFASDDGTQPLENLLVDLRVLLRHRPRRGHNRDAGAGQIGGGTARSCGIPDRVVRGLMPQ